MIDHEQKLSRRDGVLIVIPHHKSDRASSRDMEDAGAEAIGLAEAIDLNIMGLLHVNIPQLRAGTYLTKGGIEKVQASLDEIESKVKAAHEEESAGSEGGALDAISQADTVDLVYFDGMLSPVQQRNLEREWKCKVIDRTALILEIFGARAQTKEGKLQVELAALTYQRSRLVRSWTHLERQRGGAGFMGGPGETQIEIDRRIIGDRITQIKKEIDQLKKNRDLQRKARERVPFPIVALVGYTNAGKSTLFNKLTGEEIFAKDLLFATLDTTMRRVELPSGQMIILSDTVGFISNLPTQLIAAFRATLEQVEYADVILHVEDISNPNYRQQQEDVHAILEDLGVKVEESQHIIKVYNKMDNLPEDEQIYMRNTTARKGDEVTLSALTGEGCNDLLEKVDAMLARHHVEVELELPAQDGKALAWLHENADITNTTYVNDNARLRLKISQSKLEQFRKAFAYDQSP